LVNEVIRISALVQALDLTGLISNTQTSAGRFTLCIGSKTSVKCIPHHVMKIDDKY
jgi:hypothetical protein